MWGRHLIREKPLWLRRRRGIRSSGRARLHHGRVTKRAEYTFAMYAGSVADPGDRNPYSGQSLVLAQLWMRGYMRMLRVRIETGRAMARYRAARAAQEHLPA